MTGTATHTCTTAIYSIISLWASENQRSAQNLRIQSGALRGSQASENRISHLWFEAQKPVSPWEKFKSSLPFLTEQFPAPVQGIQISVIIPDTTNQFFSFLLFMFSLSQSQGEREIVWDNKRGLANGERSREEGRLNWQPWLEWRLPMRRLQMTMQQMSTEKLAWVHRPWLWR